MNAAVPTVMWSVPSEVVETWDESTEEYVIETIYDYKGGDVTAYIVDDNDIWELTDPLTGEMPQYTFKWNEDLTEYTFPVIYTGEVLDGKAADVGPYTVKLPFDLYEPQAAEPEAPPVSPDPEKTLVDGRAPSVQIVPYAIRRTETVKLPMVLRLEDLSDRTTATTVDLLNPELIPYDDYDMYEDGFDFTDDIGWASRYRFQIEVQDINKTKIVIKDGLYADQPASYKAAVSDTIKYVTLSGGILDVSGPAQFSIFVFDSEDNCVTIPMDLYNVGPL